MMKSSFPVWLLMLFFLGCKSPAITLSDEFINTSYNLDGIKCKDIPGEGMDSKVGVLECEDLSFHYDYGRYSNKGPITPKEEFRRAFDNYHHIKFFEDRMIDPKVYKLFLDSVKVVDVRKNVASDPLMFPCDPCNTTAIITFKKDTYYYPTTLSEKQLSKEGYAVKFKEEEGITYKVYHVSGERPGLYVSPTKNRFGKKNCLSLTVKESELTDQQIKDTLDKIRLQPITMEKK